MTRFQRAAFRYAALVLCLGAGAFAAFGGLAGAQESTPRPTPTPLPCARPDLVAVVLRAAKPQMPRVAEQQNISGTVHVVVSLDVASNVAAVRIQSSPNAALNEAALGAARASVYQTEIRRCRPQASEYLLDVDFGETYALSTTASGERVVTVTAQGVARRPPDVADVLAHIVTAGSTAADATAANDATYDAIKVNLRAMGIGDSLVHAALRTEEIAAHYPGSNADPRVVYRATREVAVRSNTLANARNVAVVVASAGPVDVTDVRFTLLDGRAAYREALDAALKEAERRAREAATGNHAHLGGLAHVDVLPSKDASAAPVTTLVRVFIHPQLTPVPPLDIPPTEARASATATYFLKP